MSRGSAYGKLTVGVYRAAIDPLIQRLRPKVVRICQSLAAQEVLDIASATGAQCRALGRAGIHATGIDSSDAMIDAASRLDGPNVQYVHGSAYELPFPDDAYDAVLLLLALHEHQELERARMLREALRVVRPDGALVLADYMQPPRPRLHASWTAIRCIEHMAGPNHRSGFHDFIDRRGLNGLIERHGLDMVSLITSHFSTIGVAVVRAFPQLHGKHSD